jgi:hypothetical protein
MKNEWFSVWYGRPGQRIHQGWWRMNRIEAELLANDLVSKHPWDSELTHVIADHPMMRPIIPLMKW